MSRGVPRIRASIGLGRYATGEKDLMLVPRRYALDNTKVAVIYCHYHGGDAISPCAPSGVNPAMGTLLNAVAEFLPVFSADLGTATAGTTQRDGYGNANTLARLADHKTFAQGATGGARTGKLVFVGLSMGWAACVNYARNNPANVAGMVGLLPLSDTDDVRINDRLSLRSDIDAAAGVTYPTALPAGMNPTTASYSGVTMPPSTVYYATDDVTIIPSTVTTLAGIIGSTTHSLGASGGHTNASIAAVDPDDFLATVRTYAEAA